jgi:hypothetical protein
VPDGNFADVAGVLSQQFADKVFTMRAAFSQPRWGRKIVAQGARSCEKINFADFGTMHFQ